MTSAGMLSPEHQPAVEKDVEPTPAPIAIPITVPISIAAENRSPRATR